jgi:TMEM175 potassium channel family protein
MGTTLTFVVILTFWVSHHSIFGAIRRYDRNLIWLNSLFFMCLAFLPFPFAQYIASMQSYSL